MNYTPEEARALVEEAHRLHTPVAAHAVSQQGIQAALDAGVDSMDIGQGMTEMEMDEIVKRGVYWVPTVLASVYAPPGRSVNAKLVARERAVFAQALKKHVRIAFGTDQSGFMWTAFSEAKQLEFYVAYGMTPMEAIRSATVVPAQLLGWSDRIGTIEPGKFADIIAVSGDPLTDISQPEHIKFVMKGGVVYKNDFR